MKNKKFDALIHLAAAGVHPSDRDPNNLLQINCLLPAALGKWAANCQAQAIISLGSLSEYENLLPLHKLKENDPLETNKLYGATKAAGGILALDSAIKHNCPIAVMRVSNVYGGGEGPHRLLPSLIKNLTENQPVLLSAGKQIRDFIFVQDVCAAIWNVLNHLFEKRMASGFYNLCTGIGTSVRDFATITAKVLNVSEDLLKFGAIPTRPDDTPYMVGDPSSLENSCGFRPTWTLEAGIKLASEQIIKQYA